MFFIKMISFVIWFAYLCIINKIRIFSSFFKYSNKYFIFKVHLVRPQNFAKSPPILCLMYCQSNNWWRFCKTLWPSQNI